MEDCGGLLQVIFILNNFTINYGIVVQLINYELLQYTIEMIAKASV